MGSLKNEWKLLWESLVPTDNEVKINTEDPFDPFFMSKLETITFEQLKEITRALSDDRKKMNQKLEKINKEIDLNSAKLESLRLVGNTGETTLRRIMELTDMGQGLAQNLYKIDNKLRSAHFKEEEILRA